MSKVQNMADYLGFEVVYLDGFAYIQEQGEQGTEIKKDATLEERTLWTELNAVTDELEALKRAISEAEPFGYFCDWGDYSGCQRISMYYGEPGSAIEDDWNEHPKVHQNLPLYTLKGIK